MDERDVSERGAGGAAFLLGVVVGALLGVLFAPRNLRDLAREKVGELRGLVTGDDEPTDGDEPSPRRELERRLAAARERRRSRRA